MNVLANWVEALRDSLAVMGQERPWLIFVAIVVLPGLGFPVSILLLLAGLVWGASVESCLIAMAAIILNVVWTHFAASGFAKPLVTRFLGNRWQRWESLGREDRLRLALVLRVTPGVPLCVQNYVLSLLGVPLRYSLMIAIPLTGMYVCGFVLTGGAVFEGNLGLLISGVSLLFVAAVVLKWIRARQSRRVREKP